MRLGLAHALMNLPGAVWRRLPAPVMTWAIHTHLMQFPSYRRFTLGLEDDE